MKIKFLSKFFSLSLKFYKLAFVIVLFFSSVNIIPLLSSDKNSSAVTAQSAGPMWPTYSRTFSREAYNENVSNVLTTPSAKWQRNLDNADNLGVQTEWSDGPYIGTDGTVYVLARPNNVPFLYALNKDTGATVSAIQLVGTNCFNSLTYYDYWHIAGISTDGSDDVVVWSNGDGGDCINGNSIAFINVQRFRRSGTTFTKNAYFHIQGGPGFHTYNVDSLSPDGNYIIIGQYLSKDWRYYQINPGITTANGGVTLLPFGGGGHNNYSNVAYDTSVGAPNGASYTTSDNYFAQGIYNPQSPSIIKDNPYGIDAPHWSAGNVVTYIPILGKVSNIFGGGYSDEYGKIVDWNATRYIYSLTKSIYGRPVGVDKSQNLLFTVHDSSYLRVIDLKTYKAPTGTLCDRDRFHKIINCSDPVAGEINIGYKILHTAVVKDHIYVTVRTAPNQIQLQVRLTSDITNLKATFNMNAKAVAPYLEWGYISVANDGTTYINTGSNVYALTPKPLHAPLGTISMTNSQYSNVSGHAIGTSPITFDTYANFPINFTGKLTDTDKDLGSPVNSVFANPQNYAGDIRKGELINGVIGAASTLASGSVIPANPNCTTTLCNISVSFTPATTDIGKKLVFWVRGYDVSDRTCNGNYTLPGFVNYPGNTNQNIRCDAPAAPGNNNVNLLDEDYIVINVLAPPPWFTVSNSQAYSASTFEGSINIANPNSSNNSFNTLIPFSNSIVTTRCSLLDSPCLLKPFYQSGSIKGVDKVTSYGAAIPFTGTYKNNMNSNYYDNNRVSQETLSVSNVIKNVQKNKVKCLDPVNTTTSTVCPNQGTLSSQLQSAFVYSSATNTININLKLLPDVYSGINGSNETKGVVYDLKNITGKKITIMYNLDDITIKKGIVIMLMDPSTVNIVSSGSSTFSDLSSVTIVSNKNIVVEGKNQDTVPMTKYNLGLITSSKINYICETGSTYCKITQNGFSFTKDKFDIQSKNKDNDRVLEPVLRINFNPNYIVDFQSVFQNTSVAPIFVGYDY